jgi:adenylosuccinate lyase
MKQLICCWSERRINQLVAERRQLEKAVQACKKDVTNKKTALKEATAKKQKIEKPIHVEIELLLNEYNISAAAYHGGKLNGVDC